MNTPSPLVPQGSLERPLRGKSTVRIAILTIVSIHAVFFAGLLMQGCRRDESKNALKGAELTTNQNTLPPLDSGYYAGGQDVSQASNAPSANPPPATPAVGEPLAGLPPLTASDLPASDSKIYTVAQGDTLQKIARANGVSLSALTKANPDAVPSKLRVGQKLQLPAATPPAQSTPTLGYTEPGKPETASSSNLHTVKAGETLTKIARAHGTTVKAIRAANNLKSDRLVVGQKIKLPPPQTATRSTAPAKNSALPKTAGTTPVQISQTPAR